MKENSVKRTDFLYWFMKYIFRDHFLV